MFTKKVIEINQFTSPLSSKALDRIDFQDTFSTTNKKDSLKDIGHKIFNNPPWWIILLFLIRNILVKIVGLKTSLPKDHNEEFKVGGYIGFFKIYEITEDEIIMGADDKHLNFRASIYNDHSEEYNIKVTTLVQFNNNLGRIYMKLIGPFHRLVVSSMVKKAYLKVRD